MNKKYKYLLQVFKSIRLADYLRFNEKGNENYIDYRALQIKLFQAFNKIKIKTAYSLNRDLDVLYILFDRFILIITNVSTFISIQKQYSGHSPLNIIQLPAEYEKFNSNIKFFAIKFDAFFNPFKEQIKRMYDKANIEFQTISYQTPTLHTPLMLYTRKGNCRKKTIFGYLKRINSRFLAIDGINIYYEALRKNNIKSAIPLKGVLGNIIFEREGIYYSVFSHLTGSRITTKAQLNDTVIMDVLTEASKIWAINSFNLISKSINDYIYLELMLIKTNLKNLSAIKDFNLKKTAEANVFKVLYYFDNYYKKIYDTLPNHMLHGDLHIGNIRISGKKFTGFIDQRPMSGKRIIDLLKLSIVRDNPSESEWYFSDEIFKKSIYFFHNLQKKIYPFTPFSADEIKLLTIFFRIHFLTDLVIRLSMENAEIERLLNILNDLEERYPIEASKEQIYERVCFSA